MCCFKKREEALMKRSQTEDLNTKLEKFQGAFNSSNDKSGKWGIARAGVLKPNDKSGINSSTVGKILKIGREL